MSSLRANATILVFVLPRPSADVLPDIDEEEIPDAK
jgi:hypothetical protein